MKLWLVRHARPLIEPETCYGITDMAADAAATAAQAHQLAQTLPARAWVATSPLQRCASLAAALYRLRPDLLPTSEPRLREMNFGRWEGRLWANIPKSEIDLWTEDFAEHAVGGGENVKSVIQRVAAVLGQTRSVCANACNEGHRDAVWITHAGVIRAVTLLVGDADWQHAGAWGFEVPAFGQWQAINV